MFKVMPMPGRTVGNGGAPRPPALGGDPAEYDAWMRANPSLGATNPLMGGGNPFFGGASAPGGQYNQLMTAMGGGTPDSMAGGNAGSGGIRGWWGDLDGMEKAQILAALIQGGAGAYAGYQQGKRIDEDRRIAEEERQREQEDRRARAEILGPMLAGMRGR